MTAVRVFDPAMCCSTGICGPSVDPQLVRFAADLDWLKSQGVEVERFNLSQQPAAFAGDEAAKAALEALGEAALPLVQVNGKVRSTGVYPSREQLSAWVGIGAAQGQEARPAASGCCGEAKGDGAAAASGCCGEAKDDGAAAASGCCGEANSDGAAPSSGCCGPAKSEEPAQAQKKSCC